MVFEPKCRGFIGVEGNILGDQMLTKKQLSVLARENGISLFTQERDYVQVLFLSRLYEKKSSLVFKGGTYLKLVHGLPRFSEDLDFNSNQKTREIRILLENSIKDMELVGVEAKLNSEKKLKTGVGYRLRYKGPLYDGRPVTMGSIGIDVSLRKDMVLEPNLYTIPSKYPEISPFLAYCMPVKEIFAEKIRALLKRSKPRDVYDVWFLLNKGLELDSTLIKKKMKLQGLEFDIEKLRSKIYKQGENWDRDLSTLLKPIPNFEAVKNDLIEKLKVLF